jgi:hypothetical protein
MNWRERSFQATALDNLSLALHDKALGDDLGPQSLLWVPPSPRASVARVADNLHADAMGGLRREESIKFRLHVPPGYRLEGLTRDRVGQYSIRINDPWRICYVWKDGAHDVEIVDDHWEARDDRTARADPSGRDPARRFHEADGCVFQPIVDGISG